MEKHELALESARMKEWIKYDSKIEKELVAAAMETNLDNLRKLLDDLPNKIPERLLSDSLYRNLKKQEWIIERLSSVLSDVGQKGMIEPFKFLLLETKADLESIHGFQRIGWNLINENEYTQNHLIIAEMLIDSGFGDEEMWKDRIDELSNYLKPNE